MSVQPSGVSPPIDWITENFGFQHVFSERQPSNMSAIAQGSVQQSIDPSGADQLEDHKNPVSIVPNQKTKKRPSCNLGFCWSRQRDPFKCTYIVSYHLPSINACLTMYFRSTEEQSLVCPVPGFPQANKLFTRRSTLRRHMENIHKPSPTAKSFECPYSNCKRLGKRSAFDGKDGLERHLLNCKLHPARASSSKSGASSASLGALI